MNGLAQHKVFTAVERPTDRKFEILSVQQWSTSIRSIVSKTLSLANVVCVFGEIGKSKASISSNTKLSAQFLMVGRIEFFIHSQQLTNGIFFRQILLKKHSRIIRGEFADTYSILNVESRLGPRHKRNQSSSDGRQQVRTGWTKLGQVSDRRRPGG